ncbi:hypothetical protein [Mitsuaria sp. 7]|uniref:hypothetical protein n=1 Tax=Mitsuaria sp. 7 TaxID=1658665 RepID=UPI0007DD6758|nr:hypothetical protein [Mitsuaria sp. 7]ANH66573.1 hypothetical protein ABE85_01555 [Mitsuaria sp. 7]
MFGLFKKKSPPPAPEPKTESEEPLLLVFIPALLVLLLNAEQKKGSPLTEAEVNAIRDSGVCMALPVSAALALAEKRGYPDINADEAWTEWQRARVELAQS